MKEGKMKIVQKVLICIYLTQFMFSMLNASAPTVVVTSSGLNTIQFLNENYLYDIGVANSAGGQSSTTNLNSAIGALTSGDYIKFDASTKSFTKKDGSSLSIYLIKMGAGTTTTLGEVAGNKYVVQTKTTGSNNLVTTKFANDFYIALAPVTPSPGPAGGGDSGTSKSLATGETLSYLTVELNYGANKVVTVPVITSKFTTHKSAINGALTTGFNASATLSTSGSDRQIAVAGQSGGSSVSGFPTAAMTLKTSDGTTITTSDSLADAYIVYQTTNMQEVAKVKVSNTAPAFSFKKSTSKTLTHAGHSRTGGGGGGGAGGGAGSFG